MHRRLFAAGIPVRYSSLRPPSHLLSSAPDPKLGFLREELRELQSLEPASPRLPEQGREEWSGGGGGGEREVEISHPWPEWVELMALLLRKGYLDRTAFQKTSSPRGCPKDSNQIRTACLDFARDRVDLIRYLSRKEIHMVVHFGCPSIDRKVVNSGKRLRAHLGIDEGSVCSQCNLRGSCERAYITADKAEKGRTVDVMRILITYGLDTTGCSVENKACLNKTVKESVKKLLNVMVDLGDTQHRSSAENAVSSGSCLSKSANLSGHTMPKGQSAIPMRRGDWICPKCNFLNFAKNMKCLHCNGEFQERYKMLQEDHEHLPLKKGDWICRKCNFLNFAKNTNCLQCHEKPTNRQLNAGEWECASCNYVNFRRNAVCLKCDWKRPKASLNQDNVVSQPGDQARAKNPTISFVRDSVVSDRWHFPSKKNQTPEEDSDFSSSEEDRGNARDNKLADARNANLILDSFPIVGGMGAISRDPTARQKWKGEMSERSKGLSRNESEENGGSVSARLPSSMKLDESSDEDEISSWFMSGKDNRSMR